MGQHDATLTIQDSIDDLDTFCLQPLELTDALNACSGQQRVDVCGNLCVVVNPRDILIARRIDTLITNDGKVCRPTYIATWLDAKDEVMDGVCERRWGCKFSTMRSLWFDRLHVRYGLKTWNLVKLDIVDELG